MYSDVSNYHEERDDLQNGTKLYKSTVYDAGFTMIAMIHKFRLTVWSIYMMFDDNYVRQMCACLWTLF
jgi:hypothetical protein